VGGTSLSLLDRETRAFHAEADRGWNRLLQADATRGDYIHQLTVTYGFEAPFELACAYTPGLSQAIDLRGRSRSALIVRDLVVLGCPIEDGTALPCATVGPFEDTAEALAWLYVVERQTSLYVGVREQLIRRFVDLAGATTYLGAYEETGSRRWSQLGIALDWVGISNKVRKRVVDAACAAFAALLEWQRTSGERLRGVG